jgi:hypothetical protein
MKAYLEEVISVAEHDEELAIEMLINDLKYTREEAQELIESWREGNDIFFSK